MAATSRTQMTSSLKCRNWSAQLRQITRYHSVYTLVHSDTQTEFHPMTDVQPAKDVAPQTMVRQASVGDESRDK